MTDIEYQFKLVLIGHDKSGKSSLISRFVSNSFSSSYVATIGTDFKVRNLTVGGKICQLQIWDTAGLSCFQSAPETVYHNAHGIYICFDVTKRNSFDSLTKWLHQAQTHSPLDAIIYIIGCKCDSSYHSRKVSREEAELFATSKGCRFGEVSAKSNTNVDQIFQEMSILLRDQADQEAENDTLVRRSTLTEGNRLLQSAYAVHISGATSWYNANKINGRYVPQMSKTPTSGTSIISSGSSKSRKGQVEEFSYANIDSPRSVMVYRNNEWVIKVRNKPLARVGSNSILCFPDTASAKNVWYENTGVYFTWWHARPGGIKCVMLNTGAAGSSGNGSGKSGSSNNPLRDSGGGSRGSFSFSAGPRGSFSGGGAGSGGSGGKSTSGALASVAAGVLASGPPPGLDIFAGARAVQGNTGMNMELFLQCSKEPSRIGLSSPLFVHYCVIRLAMLEFERKYVYTLASSSADSRSLLHICAQLQRVQETVRDMAAALKIEINPTPHLLTSVAGAGASAGGGVITSATAGLATGAGLSLQPPSPLALSEASPSPLPQSPSPQVSANPYPTTPRAAAAAAAGPPSHTSGPLLEVSSEAIVASIREFTRPLSRHLLLLCDVESGNFEQARRCRDVRLEVEQYVLDLQKGSSSPGHRTSFSASFSGRNSFSASARNSFIYGKNNGSASNRGSFSRTSFSGRNSFSTPTSPPLSAVVTK